MTVFTGKFDASKSFVGEMTRLNVWKQRVKPPYAETMGRGCGLWNGNVLRRSEMKSRVVGNVQIIPSCECFIPGQFIDELKVKHAKLKYGM